MVLSDKVVEDMEVCNQEVDNNVNHKHMENDNHLVVDKMDEEVGHHVVNIDVGHPSEK